MRRLSASILKQLVETGKKGVGPKLAAVGTEGEIQAVQQASNARRGFSFSPLASSAAAEAKVNSVPPYVTYGAVGAVFVGGLAWYMSGQPHDSSLAAVTNKQAPAAPADRDEYPQFHVQDHMGMHFTQEELLGNFAVIFFGSIDHPGRRQRLLQMAEAVMESDRQSNMQYLTPVFATLKPDVDDVIKMNAMVQDYATALNRKDILHVRLKGITGPDNLKLHDAAQKYTHKVKARSSAVDSPAVTKDDQSDLYLVNPEGEFLASYGPEASSKDVGKEWAEIIKNYKQKNPSWHGPKAVKARTA